MTALAVALVLCCAMVCGTRLILRRYDVQESDAERSIRADMNLARRISEVEEKHLELSAAMPPLRSAVDSLRAQAALRGM